LIFFWNALVLVVKSFVSLYLFSIAVTDISFVAVVAAPTAAAAAAAFCSC
jgi:hypothetical protein